MQNEVLITGAGGFIGMNLKPYLETNGFICQTLSFRKGQGVLVSDIPFAVIHLAGIAHDLKNSQNPQDYYTVNTELTKKLFDKFLLSDSKIFIFISSVKAVADSVEGVLTEDDGPSPQTEYGKSKLLAEQYLQSKEMPSGKRVYILRPCMIHGPGNKGNLNLLYKIARLGIPYPLAAFENKRSFLSVHNLCFVIEQLLRRDDIEPAIYQISDDPPISTNQLMTLFSEVLSKKIFLLRINKKLITKLAQLGDKLHLPFNTERLNKLTENFIVSNDKIRIALRKPFPVSTEDGLRITIRSFGKGQNKCSNF